MESAGNSYVSSDNKSSILPEALGLCPVSSLKDKRGKKLVLKKETGNELKVDRALIDNKSEFKQLDKAKNREPFVAFQEEHRELPQGIAEEKFATKAQAGAFGSRKRKTEIANADHLDKIIKPVTGLESHPYKLRAERLNNFLSSKHAFKWLLRERFESYLDTHILKSYNNFLKCLQTVLPKFEMTPHHRLNWFQVRSMIGKPRRFSAEFIHKERVTWERKRIIIRLMQTKSIAYFKDSEMKLMCNMPTQIPRVLTKGTQISAILHASLQGLHNGIVESYNEDTCIYNIRFSNTIIGEQSVPDFEIFPVNNCDMLNVQGPYKHTNDNDETFYEVKIVDGEVINGYAVRDLKNMLKLKRTVELHSDKIKQLISMNNEAKENISRVSSENDDNESVSSEGSNEQTNRKFRNSNEFQRNYAAVLLAIEKLDREMLEQIDDVEKFRTELEFLTQSTDEDCDHNELYQRCHSAACATMVRNDNPKVMSLRARELIKNLVMCLKMMQVISVNNNAGSVLETHLENIKQKLFPRNVKLFEDAIEKHVLNVQACFENSKKAMSKGK